MTAKTGTFMRCNRCHRSMAGLTPATGACECGGLIESAAEGILTRVARERAALACAQVGKTRKTFPRQLKADDWRAAFHALGIHLDTCSTLAAATFADEFRRELKRIRQARKNNPQLCEDCQGWGFAHMDDPHEVERCDLCQMYESDEAARYAHRHVCGCDWPEGGEA